MKRLPSQSLFKLLRALSDHPAGGVFDRWLRIIVVGETVTKSGSTIPLTAFRYGLVRMNGERVELTPKGRDVLQDPGHAIAS